MHRTPPRRSPRIAAIVRQHGRECLVVLDPWEVRAVATARTSGAGRLRRVLAAEEPELVVVLGRRPRWLPVRLPVEVVSSRPEGSAPAFPELRRFAGGALRKLVETAATLAFDALTRRILHAESISKN